jgi:hypothetical protein
VPALITVRKAFERLRLQRMMPIKRITREGPPRKVIPYILELVSRSLLPLSSPQLTSVARSSLEHPPVSLYRPTLLHRPLPLALSFLPLHRRTLFNLGCCFAQDLQNLCKMAHLLRTSTKLYGEELKPEFISLSYELFLY